jgi:RNA polymerase sigma-70 factor, ECF subfamily
VGKLDCENLDAAIREGGDPSALMASIAACLGGEIRRFAETRCGRRRGDLEDISQDVLLAAQRYLSTFRGEASLRTWLYRLVLSACSRRRRGRKNDPSLHRSIDDDAAGVLESPQGADPEVMAMVSERLAALDSAMRELREEDRELLRAVEWEGLGLEEVGRRHGLTVPAMKSRMFRIRRQLKELMNRTFDSEVEEAAPQT